jgi:hypothetical protein
MKSRNGQILQFPRSAARSTSVAASGSWYHEEAVRVDADAPADVGHQALHETRTFLTYDFETRVGTLHLRPGRETNLKACTELFVAIDPEVECIETRVGNSRSTTYVRTGNGWLSVLPG